MPNRLFAERATSRAPKPGFGERNTNVLDVIPVVNSAVRVELQTAGALLWVPIRRRWWMGAPLSWVLPFREEKGIALDGLGRQVLEACDGTATVERVVEDFAKRHRLRFHEARQSVLTFLKMLLERKVILFVVEPPFPCGECAHASEPRTEDASDGS